MLCTAPQAAGAVSPPSIACQYCTSYIVGEAQKSTGNVELQVVSVGFGSLVQRTAIEQMHLELDPGPPASSTIAATSSESIHMSDTCRRAEA